MICTYPRGLLIQKERSSRKWKKICNTKDQKGIFVNACNNWLDNSSDRNNNIKISYETNLKSTKKKEALLLKFD